MARGEGLGDEVGPLVAPPREDARVGLAVGEAEPGEQLGLASGMPDDEAVRLVGLEGRGSAARLALGARRKRAIPRCSHPTLLPVGRTPPGRLRRQGEGDLVAARGRDHELEAASDEADHVAHPGLAPFDALAAEHLPAGVAEGLERLVAQPRQGACQAQIQRLHRARERAQADLAEVGLEREAEQRKC